MAIEDTQAIRANIVTGKVTGTGAAINISTGFVPMHVMVWNVTNIECHVWNASMDDASSIQLSNTCASTTSNGITPYDGGDPTVSSGTTGGASNGVTLGTDISINTDVLYYTIIG